MWTALIPVMVKYGVEFAYQLWANIKSDKEPTQEDWDKLLALSTKTYDDYVNEALAKRGVKF